MSLICLIGAIYMFADKVAPDTEYFVIWALFSIADALWFGRAKK